MIEVNRCTSWPNPREGKGVVMAEGVVKRMAMTYVSMAARMWNIFSIHSRDQPGTTSATVQMLVF